jgi:tRNA(Arg) A34 adenosine deaminase TadA
MSDDKLMRAAFAAASRAAENGNPPFGSVLVDPDGKIVLEAENTVASDSDCTGHAETNLVREASRKYGVGVLDGYTLVTSCEPCAMCAAAIFWSGISRLVYGLSHARLVSVRTGGPPMLKLDCREVFSRGAREVAVTGPMLEDEGAALFGG